MNTPIEKILQKEVSRKEFLGMSGLAVASIFGFGTILKLLTGHSFEASSRQIDSGYGSSSYGGKSK